MREVIIKGHPKYLIREDGIITRQPHSTLAKDGKIYKRKRLIRKCYIGDVGYLRIEIQRKRYFVHRLLAQHFIPNPDNKPTVNHIDGNKLNNDLSNLEWASYSENNQHAYDVLGKVAAFTGKPSPSAKGVKVYQRGNFIGSYTSILKAALAHKICTSQLGLGLRRTSGKYKNKDYVFEYAG